MKYNKSIWAAALSAVGVVITILGQIQPFLPSSTAAVLSIALMILSPLIVYLVPNIDRIVGDVTAAVDDVKDKNYGKLATDGGHVIADAGEVAQVVNEARKHQPAPVQSIPNVVRSDVAAAGHTMSSAVQNAIGAASAGAVGGVVAAVQNVQKTASTVVGEASQVVNGAAGEAAAAVRQAEQTVGSLANSVRSEAQAAYDAAARLRLGL